MVLEARTVEDLAIARWISLRRTPQFIEAAWAACGVFMLRQQQASVASSSRS